MKRSSILFPQNRYSAKLVPGEMKNTQLFTEAKSKFEISYLVAEIRDGLHLRLFENFLEQIFDLFEHF